MHERKVIFKVDARIGNTGKVFKKCQVYNICDDTLKNYTVDYDSDSSYKIPKDQRDIVYYAFTWDEQESSLRAKILREENAALNTPTPLTRADSGGIIESENSIGEAEVVEEKVMCSNCGSEYNRQLLVNKQETDDIVCPLCNESFNEKATCPSCGSTFDKRTIKEKGIKSCPACGEKFEGKKVKVSRNWELAYSTRDIEKYNEITLVCQKCESVPSVPVDKFEILTPEQCKLKDGETIKCQEPGCKNVLTADFIVLAEKPVEPETHTVTCPTCGSHDVKKIKLGSKIIAAGLLDVLSVGYISKTFACQNCKFTW